MRKMSCYQGFQAFFGKFTDIRIFDVILMSLLVLSEQNNKYHLLSE